MKDTKQTTYKSFLGDWPPPWWSVVSLIALLAIVAGLIWVGLALSGPLSPSGEWPTPVLLTVTPPQDQLTPQLDATPAVTGQFEPGDQVQVSGTGGLDLRLRSGPGTLYETIKLVAEGTRMEIVGDPRQADSYLWWPVRDLSDGAQGWVVSDFLQKKRAFRVGDKFQVQPHPS